MNVVLCDEVEEELKLLPMRERVAMLTALEKLEALGDQLPSSHSSAVKSIKETLRELRPRAGRSPLASVLSSRGPRNSCWSDWSRGNCQFGGVSAFS